MGAGKSTAARVAAAELGVEPLDSDRELERTLGEPIESFFDREGEAAFRAREEEVVLELLGRPDARVVALGGGALGSERVRDALRGHTVVHLEVGAEEAWRRASGKGRPLARDRGAVRAAQARPRGRLRVASPRHRSRRCRATACGRAVPALDGARGARRTGTRLVWASAASGEYPVFFGRGLVGGGLLPPATTAAASS